MTSHDRRPAALLIGPARQVEFREPVQLLEARTRLRRAATAERALPILGASYTEPEIVVVAQSRPGEVNAGAIEQLRAAAPLARFVQLLGAWCEGETRSGTPWPAETRLFWDQFVPRMTDCFDRLARGECPDWGLPPCASNADLLLMNSRRALDGSEPKPTTISADTGALIAVHTSYIGTFETLADVFAIANWRSVWQRPARADSAVGVTAGCFDGSGMEDPETEALVRFQGQIEEAPLLVLLDFLRHDTQRQAVAAGAAAVLAKPYLVDDLLMSMRQVIHGKTALVSAIVVQ